MGSKKSRHRSFSEEFILDVLRDYYSSGMSKSSIARKYDVEAASIYQWLKRYDLEGKELSLSREIIDKVKSMDKNGSNVVAPQTREEELERQLSALRKALEYSELRNEALMTVIRIGEKDYGMDLLKKAGAKQ